MAMLAKTIKEKKKKLKYLSMGKLEVEENRTGGVLPTNDDLPQTCKFDVLQMIYKSLLKGQFCSNLLRVTTASQQGSA